MNAVGREGDQAVRVLLVVHPVASDVAEVRAAVEGAGGEVVQTCETTVEDPGTQMTRRALQEHDVDLVIAAGGDGTVRAVAAAALGHGVPVALVPTGTGNLLARNLQVPLDQAEAVQVALHGTSRTITCGRSNGELFLVMAGIGLDAAMVEETPPRLKKVLGWPAYALTLVKHLRERPMDVKVSLDSGPWQEARGRAVIVGNVGELQGGIALFPEADPEAGTLEMAVLSARTLRGWVRLGAHLLSRPEEEDEQVMRGRFQHLVVETRRDHPTEVDGDPQGPARRLEVEIAPETLEVKVPR